MSLESAFNRLCNSRFGYLMIPVVGVGVLGFVILVIETARYLHAIS